MAQISDLSKATSADNNDELLLRQGGEDKAVSIRNLQKQWQENLYPTWIEDDGTGVAYAYPVGMIVNHDGKNWVSNDATNQEEPGTGLLWDAFKANKNVRIQTTVAEIATGVFSVGDKLTVTDRANALFNIVSGGTPDGYGVLNAGIGKTAVYTETRVVDGGAFGLTLESQQAAINYAVLNNANLLNLSPVNLIGGLVVDGASKLLVNGNGIHLTSDTVDEPPFLVQNCNKINIGGVDAKQVAGGNRLHTSGAIIARNSTKVYVRGSDIDSTNFNGIVFVNINKGKISRSDVTSSTVNPETITTNNVNSGIAVIDGCKKIKVVENNIEKQGIGVNVQAIGAGVDIEKITVSDNDIENCYGYGVNLYSLASIVRDCHVNINRISTIWGQVLNLAVGAYSHGAGIYLQAARGTTVSGNIIKDVNKNTNNSSLVPAAIGMNGGFGNNITGNICSIGEYWGIAVVNAPLSGTSTTVSSNILNGFAEGTHLFDSHNVTMNNNTVTACGKGFFAGVVSQAFNTNCTISSNSFCKNTGIGMDFSKMKNSPMTSNAVNDNGSFGMSFLSCENVSFDGSTTCGNGAVGFRDNGGSTYTADGLISQGNTGGNEAQVGSPLARTNFYSGTDVLTVGSYAPIRNQAIVSSGINGGNGKFITVNSGSGDVIKLDGMNIGEKCIFLFTVVATLKDVSSGGGARFKLSGGVDYTTKVGDIFEFIVKSGAEIYEVSRKV